MIVQRTKTYAVCPSCGQDAGAIDHLLGQTLQTSWYCDSCGDRYALTFFADGRVDVAKTNGRKVETMDLLVLQPKATPIYFIVPGMRFEGERDGETREDELEHKQFYYEEHSCPVNWLKPEVVYQDGDSDPHGFVTFVDTIDANSLPADENYGPNDRDTALTAWIERHAVTPEMP